MPQISSSVRRKLARAGFVLNKFRGRNPDDYRFGGYMIIDAETNAVVQGAYPLPYNLTPDDVREFAREIAKAPA